MRPPFNNTLSCVPKTFAWVIYHNSKQIELNRTWLRPGSWIATLDGCLSPQEVVRSPCQSATSFPVGIVSAYRGLLWEIPRFIARPISLPTALQPPILSPTLSICLHVVSLQTSRTLAGWNIYLPTLGLSSSDQMITRQDRGPSLKATPGLHSLCTYTAATSLATLIGYAWGGGQQIPPLLWWTIGRICMWSALNQVWSESNGYLCGLTGNRSDMTH